ncbi:hypothetical protein FA15DRAFT_681990 [Coprinopsis marcescibilis]|uniref:Uncharacterized protein n=1 Tax=Coprinopsis marcescibilis TaxID=230819 RepID=A0A5C3KMT2_COPMA|nr:hypothetical protein FA15DRAFT_681990 [Coprinopsis marcescibilis]
MGFGDSCHWSPLFAIVVCYKHRPSLDKNATDAAAALLFLRLYPLALRLVQSLSSPRHRSPVPASGGYCGLEVAEAAVPASSSPPLALEHQGSSDSRSSRTSSTRSIDYAYSLCSSDSSVSTSTEQEEAFRRTEFSKQLTQRLLTLASAPANVSGHSFPRHLSNASVAQYTQPISPEYRMIKRASSMRTDANLTPMKYRRIEDWERRLVNRLFFCSFPTAYTATTPSSPSSLRFTGNWMDHVPVIAPPPSYNPRLPLSNETAAKIRLGKFLEREGNERIRDGFLQPARAIEDRRTSSPDLAAVSVSRLPLSVVEWEKALGLGRGLRERVIAWIVEKLPKHPSGQCASTAYDSSETSSRASSFASISSTVSELSNLYDQLSSCPQTRFHAVWMFLRHFFLVSYSGTDDEDQPKGLDATSGLLGSDREENDIVNDLMVWDVALACLTLSVKFHRDFLEPLCPIHPNEFLELAPHDVNYEELETAQRDVLSALSYSVGVSPQPVLDEVWRALPSLRELLHFEGGWNGVQKEVWLRLYDLIYVPDILRYPQSLLVATALIDALPSFLTNRLEYQSPWHCKTIRKRGCLPSDHARDKKARLLKRAGDDCEGVIQDIRAAVGISDEQLNNCQKWWRMSLSSIG